MKSCAHIVGLVAMSLLASSPLKAQTSWSSNAQYCAQLEGELARLQRTSNSGSSQNFKKYDAAYHKQLSEIDSAKTRAKRDGCYGGRVFLFRRKEKATCPALLKRIDKMEKNLESLEKKRSRFTPPPSETGPLKAELLSKLAQANCGDQYEQFSQIRQPRQRRGIFGTLFNSNSRYSVREYGLKDYDIPEIGTYRTVCVRACDGFFFPVSFATTESSFQRDAQACETSCPGGNAELYVYRNPGETTDDMVSLSGQPYTALETAFLYQKEYVQGCSCQVPASQLQALTNSDTDTGMGTDWNTDPTAGIAAPPSLPAQDMTDSQEQALPGSTIPLPLPKQAAMLDPDTLAMQRLGMAFEPYRPPEVSKDSNSVQTADGRSIRIVGPRFFGTQ
ncbi:DUF2865 domain-containing protein [uncultured Cohaesibacter sp.]|uniref:DUF2865 domain-containing protein n=1 Tax=uncultured Cohaesibacter sp. TaxID=1002546 RepID=UPI00292EE113|nr:DUF2865 domain-containing protein [uncultured Cohaesibacter sp.]